MFDAHVIGAGPVGCVATIAVARKGKNVLLSEEHTAAGRKPCSGLFSLSGLKTLEKYCSWKDTVETEIYGAELHLGDSMLTVKKRSPIAAVCHRDKFDKLLAQTALEEGAAVQYGRKVTGTFRSKKIIGADGANSTVAAHFRFPRMKKFIGTLQGEINGTWDEQLVQVFLSSEFPGFFGWVIPRGGRKYELGCGVQLPYSVKDAFELLKRRLGATDVQNMQASIIPIKPRSKTGKSVGGYDVMLVGDAAGQAKATTGGGVLFGSWCAEIAAAKLDSLHYEVEWQAKYGKELLLHRAARKFLNRLDDKQLTELGKRLADRKFNEFLEQHGEMDKVSDMAMQLALRPQLLL
ncbi:MAG: NAD(P)/FAD-dependent oxidoreductase [Candidatus Micrarchaeota archaeon]